MSKLSLPAKHRRDAWAAQQNTALLLMSRASASLWGSRQRVWCKVRDAWVHEGIFYTARLHLNECDSVIGSSENPNEAVSTSAAALLPVVPAQPAGQPQSPTTRSRSKARLGWVPESQRSQSAEHRSQLLWMWLQQNQWEDESRA